jgi:ubiquinone/menaquinone biosynthesis C-methylase UbiE
LHRSKSWEGKVEAIEQLARGAGFVRLRDLIIGRARLHAADRVLDIGAGTGLLTLAAAPEVDRVISVDVSPAMCERLKRKLANYCLHHLRDGDKRVALREIRRVLRPGGRVVLGDMMFDVGVRSTRDRTLILRFVRAMVRRGPAGLLRLAKNVMRVLTGRGEHPRSVDWWRSALAGAGCVEVSVQALDHEGGVAAARLPG